MWRNKGGCKVIDSGKHYIDFEVENNQLGRWRYTGFYGCPERGRRKESWNLLKSLAARSSLPWCVMGDFNDMMFVDEKRGGKAQPQHLLDGFVDTINNCGLMDLGFKGEKFTWEKSRGKINWVQERLDRGLATQTWRDLFPDAEVNVLEITTSDHMPLYLHLNKRVYVPKERRFRFENTWLREKECVNVVKMSWEFTEGRDILDKLNYCGLQLQEWGGGVHKEFKDKIQGCRTRLKKLRSRRDLLGIELYNTVRWEYLNLLEKQEIYWKQRSKQFWLQMGDQNTRFFHSYATSRRKNNKLQRIKNRDGQWCEKKEEIHDVVVDYFSQLFQSAATGGKLSSRENVAQLSDRENMELMSDITEEEVKSAVFSMHPDKSPGPDGLNPAFYQSFWHIVKEDVVGFCKQVMITGELPNLANRTLVCLIPKVKEPHTMAEIRPISLCNVLVRILSKVLSNRLKGCITSIVSDKQSAFIEGRLLTDNALLAFEVNHFMKCRTQGKNGLAGLKIDISKAYDRIEWDFLQNMMERFGFHTGWIERIMNLVRSVTYTFLHDGEQFGAVVPRRGLRQGDPISPYLYILCAEGLSSIIRRNEDAGLLHGCKVAKDAPIISHLLFADDCYFFFKAVKSEANVMKRILNRYEEISGQVVNYNKSMVTFSPNTTTQDREEVCNQLEVQEHDRPGNYLGLPMYIGRRKVSVFNFLTEKVEQKLQGWRNKKISKGGKVLLLKTAAQCIPNFWMNLMLIPNVVCENIERKMNAYWWGNNDMNNGIRWMAWDRICEVKEAGGLGFKRLRGFNKAMLGKQAWRIINNCNPLVTKLIKARYFPNTDFLNADLGPNPSYIWRSILQSKDVIQQGCRKRIGDGQSTKVWQVSWLPCQENGYLTTEMPAELQHTMVCDLFETDQRRWDMEILQDLCNDRDRDLILQVPIPTRSKKDDWFWLWDDKGEFTVKSCYRQIHGEVECVDKGFWRKVWSLKVPGKITNFLWRVCCGVLPTNVALIQKHVNVESVCCWCQAGSEDTIHVLFGCCFAKEVWESVGLHQMVTYSNEETVMDIFKSIFNTGTTDQCVLTGLICWGLWCRRNKWIWERINMSVFGVKSMALNLLTEWSRMLRDKEIDHRRHSTGTRRWCRPSEGWIKLNTDAACKRGGAHIGLGCIVRDDRGRFVRAPCSTVRGIFQPREAEALSLKEALSWSKEWTSSKCIYETDSKLLVDAVYGTRGKSYFDTIVEDCVEMFKHFEQVLVVFVSRSANTVAHTLAQVAYSESDLQEWHINAPEFIACNLKLDEN